MGPFVSGDKNFPFQNKKQLSLFFEMKNSMCVCVCVCVCVCTGANGLTIELGIQYKPGEWRIFIDSSMTRFKAVLHHSGQTLPSVPWAHAVNMKETYESMTGLLQGIKYKEHGWQICCDLRWLHCC